MAWAIPNCSLNEHHKAIAVLEAPDAIHKGPLLMCDHSLLEAVKSKRLFEQASRHRYARIIYAPSDLSGHRPTA